MADLRSRLSAIFHCFTSRQAVTIGATLIALGLALAAPLGVRQAKAQGPTTWIVTTNGDSSGGTCTPANCDTLRDAMTAAMSDTGDTIQFSISNTTITLGSTLPDVNKTLTIDGTTQKVTISGNNAVEVFTVNSTGRNGNLMLNNLTVANGKSIGSGGAVSNDGTLTITNSTFFSNSSSAAGRGVYNSFDGVLTIRNSAFSGNSAPAGGGVDNDFNETSGTVIIQNSTFSNNSASGFGGGGLFNNGGIVSIQNSTFAGNSASGSNGGGLFNEGTVTIQNSTFSGNSAVSGGGLYNDLSIVNFGSTIVARNTVSGNGPDVSNNIGTIHTLGNNLIGDGTGSSGFTNGSNGDQVGTSANPINPQLGPLTSNGGPTQTMALPVNSPAYQTGNCSGITTDQRGLTRKSPNCDIGAFEETFTFNPTGPTLTGGTVGATYSQNIVASGGTGPYTYALLSGTLPPGLSISSSGNLSGVPTTAGTYNFSIEATDSGGIVGAIAYSLTIAPGGTSTTTANVVAVFSASNQSVTLSATVTNTSNPGVAVNEGTVTFTVYQDSARTNQVGSAVTSGTVSNGNASASFTMPGGTGIGQYYVKAVYNPGADFTGSSDLTHILSNYATPNSTITVSTTSDAVPNANCNNAYVSTCALRTAIEYGSAGDTISFSVTGTITLAHGTLTIQAVGNNPNPIGNTNATGFTVSGPGAQSLAIDGGHTGGSTGVTVFTVNSGVTASLSGLTVQHGYNTFSGGGLENSGTVTITNSTFANNIVSFSGGGVDNTGTVTINNSTFINNTASSPGGGGVWSSGTVTISNSTFSGNTVPAGATDGGGGVLNNGGMLSISNSTFSSNSAPNAGGGVWSSGTVTISNSTFSGNSTAYGGGGLYNFGGTATITNSTFASNTATGIGFGGGVSNSGGMVTITYSTFSGNSAVSSGGGVDNFGTLTLGSTIVAGNTVSGGSGPDISATVNSLGYNLIGNTNGASGFVSTDQQNVNPQISVLGNYGGTTQTFLLLPGSPAIGMGNCAFPLPVIWVGTDQRGVARKVTGVGCDVGAFEDFGFNPATLPNGLLNNNYSQPITASGGTSPYTFSTVSGLPNGITLTNGGTLQGAPTQHGVFPFTFTATDHKGFVVQWGYTLTVSVQPDTIGVYRTSAGLFLLRNSNTTGNADIAFAFKLGNRPYPVIGNWTTGGTDTVGLYDESNGQYFLRNSNSAGSPDEQFVLGNPNDAPIAGQWTVSGAHDGVGVFRPSNGLLLFRNSLSTGFADYVMVLGIPGDQGLAGDWGGVQHDGPGVYRPSSQLFLPSNTICNCSVYADYVAQLGNPGDNPVTGDWIGQGHAGIGVFRPTNGLILLKNQIATGFADIVIVYGIPNDVPIAGHWTANSPAVNRSPNVLVAPTAAPAGTPIPGGSNLGG